LPALEHILCALIFVGHAGDVGSTYLVTPTLKLEANPLARKLRWPFALAGFLLCLVPYWNLALAVPVALMSLLATADNLRFAWIARAIGEDELFAFYARAARASHLWVAIGLLFTSACFTILAGLLLLLFYPHPDKDWGYWFAIGIVVYGAAVAFYRSMFARRIFRAIGPEPELTRVAAAQDGETGD
jgi:hypothetical protein